MRMIQYFNGQVKKLNIFDLKLIQGSAMILALIIVKMVPQILAVNIWWLVGLLVLFLVRPAYAFYFNA